MLLSNMRLIINGAIIFAVLLQNSVFAYDEIVGYQPTTDVSDVLMLDLDQYNIEEQLIQRKVLTAKLVYEQGGHSQSYAVLNMTAIAGSYAFESGSNVWAHNNNGMQVKGTLLNDVAWESTENETYQISVLYATGQGYVNCQVGALYLSSQASLDNCFAASGTVRIAPLGGARSQGHDFPYSYNVRVANMNGRTLRQLSINAASVMRDPAGSFFDDFQLFLNYYGQPDYGDHWIESALAKNTTNFRSGLGNADFSQLASRYGQGEAIMKGTVVLSVYMYTIGRLEESVVNCQIGCMTADCKLKATHNLDEAVAYYAGSLSMNNTDNTTGIFLYGLADNRAHNFKTSGPSEDSDTGTASVNLQIIQHLNDMQSALAKGDSASCAQATAIKKEVIRLMRIPLIQSVLGYAYIRANDDLKDEDEIEKTEAKGAAYTAAVLPYVYNCNPKSAQTLYDQMRIGSDSSAVNYMLIRKALESSYSCLNISCVEVGGIWDGQQYAPDAAPCSSSGGQAKGSRFLKTFLSLVALVTVAMIFIRYRTKRRTNRKDFMSQGNIHAVSEIS